MPALDDLKASNAALAAAVAANTAAINAKLAQPVGVPEADVAAAAAEVQGLATTLAADAARLV